MNAESELHHAAAMARVRQEMLRRAKADARGARALRIEAEADLREAVAAAGGVERIQRLQDFYDQWRPRVHHKRRPAEERGDGD